MLGILKMIEMSRGTIPIAQRAQNINVIWVAIARHTLLGDVGLAAHVGLAATKIDVDALFQCRNWGAHGAVG